MNNVVQCGDVNFSGGPRTGWASRHGEEGLSAAASWSSDDTVNANANRRSFAQDTHACTCAHAHGKGDPRLKGEKRQSGGKRAAATNTKASAQIKIQSLY